MYHKFHNFCVQILKKPLEGWKNNNFCCRDLSLQFIFRQNQISINESSAYWKTLSLDLQDLYRIVSVSTRFWICKICHRKHRISQYGMFVEQRFLQQDFRLANCLRRGISKIPNHLILFSIVDTGIRNNEDNASILSDPTKNGPKSAGILKGLLILSWQAGPVNFSLYDYGSGMFVFVKWSYWMAEGNTFDRGIFQNYLIHIWWISQEIFDLDISIKKNVWNQENIFCTYLLHIFCCNLNFLMI